MERDQLKKSLELLFEFGDARDVARNLGLLRDYFSYLADSLDVEISPPKIDTEMASFFDSSILLLRRQASYFPQEYAVQVDKILADSNCQEVIALVSNLPSRQVYLFLRAQEMAFALTRIFFSKLWRLDSAIDPAILNRATLFRSKVAVKRLSEVVRYLKMVEPERSEETFRDLSSHFDVQLVSRERLTSVVRELRESVVQVPDPVIRSQLEQRIGKIESELKKKAPNWLAIIAGIFAIVGFVSDIKSLAPSVYDPILHRANKIVEIILAEARVSTRSLPMPSYPALPQPQGLLPQKFALPPSRDEDEEKA